MDKFINLKAVLSNTRSRVVLIFTGLVLVFAIIVGIGLFSRNTGKSEARINSTPQISSIVGGFDHKVDPRYAKLLQEQNRQQAQQALRDNGTAVPTIINANFDSSAANTSCNNTAAPQAAPKTVPVGTVCADGTVRDADGKVIGQTGLVAPGGLVYDKNGNIIGTVGPDGQVRDANGNVIGTLAADGTIRDAQGNIIGTTTGPGGAGKAVYDANGKLLGYVGADGKVRDAAGNVIGTVGPDGQVRDASGQVIGKVADSSVGKPVYDANGKLLGYVGADGKVRDAFGKVIGAVGPDGQVRDASGHVIGKVADSSVGKAVYDANGKLLGYVGADGKVRDASGKVIGTVGADGQVRDASGHVIGKVSTAPKPGTLVYGKNGQVIGTIGADGKVRDANGNVIGTVGPDGVVRNLNGNVIGDTNPTAPGTAVYDAQGRLLGTVGPDGKVRDANGNVIGSVGPDGVVRDASGRPIGRTSYIAPGSAVFGPDGKLLGTIGPDGRLVAAHLGPTINGNPSDLSSLTAAGQTPQEQAMTRQQTLLQQQKAKQMVLQLQNAMSAQMSLLNSAWAPPTQQVTAGGAADAAAAGGEGSVQAGDKASANKTAALVKAGTIMFAVLDTAVNSDEPGPIMATITDGKLKGSKLLGTLTPQGQKAMLTFTTASLPDAAASAPLNAVAIDPSTARTGLSSDTNNHYLLRYGTLFASSFLSGYAQALTQSGSQTTYTVDGIVHTYPALDSKQKALVALGNVGQQYSVAVGSLFNTPPTVKIYAGTGVGVLFLSDMATPAGLESSN